MVGVCGWWWVCGFGVSGVGWQLACVNTERISWGARRAPTDNLLFLTAALSFIKDRRSDRQTDVKKSLA